MIQSIWQVESINSFQQELILPKGVVEIIFNFSDCPPISANLGSRQYYLPNCFINGVNKATIQLDITAHQLFFGVTFQPLAIKKNIWNTRRGIFRPAC